MMLWWSLTAMAVPVEIVVREDATGDPTEATIEVMGTGDAVAVDDRGRILIDLDGAGPWVLRVSSEGREDLLYEVATPLPERVKIWLPPADRPVEIVVEGLKWSADVSRQVVDGEQARETPGTLDDAFRLVQSLPGNVVQREYSPTSSDLSVRGSQPGDNRYYLDGIEVPYLYHFNQYASVFPASQIGQLELLSSTFSARYGDAVGAVVEAQSKLERPEGVHGSASMNFVTLGGDLRAPLGDRWWVSVAGRRSYQDLAGEQTTQFSSWPTFYDLVVRAEQGTERRGVGLFVAAAGDGYTRAIGELDVLDPLEIEATPDLEYDEGFTVVGVRRQVERARTALRSVTGYVRHRRDATVANFGNERLATDQIAHRTDLRLTPRPGGTLMFEVGTEVRAGLSQLEVDETDLGIRVAEEAPILARGRAVDDRLTRAQVGAYATAFVGSPRVRVMPGVRVEGDSATVTVRAQPRLAARAQLTDTTMIKAATGRYAQWPRTVDLIAQGDLPVTEAWQATVGIEQAIAGRLELGLEAYAKWIEQPTFAVLDAPLEVLETGRARGIEFTTRYRLRERFFFSGFVALQESTVVDNDGVRRPTVSDQRVAAGLVASGEWGRYTLGARYKVASGLPFTPITGSIYDASADRWLPLVGAPNADRLPTYHKVDLRFARRWTFRGWALDASAEIWYVPPASNQLYPVWNFDYSQQGWVVGPGLLPLIGARATW
ncbi:MAG: TonB-dependent receptor plug domain-containing protein [Myxococcota bacterium]